MANRTALLIRCSRQEAFVIRSRAQIERRTISNYLLNIVMRAVESEEVHLRMLDLKLFQGAGRGNSPPIVRFRTAILVRCSMEEATRIRAAARRKRVTISDYVLQCVTRSIKSTLPHAFLVAQPQASD